MSSHVYIATHIATSRHYVGKSNEPEKRWARHIYSASHPRAGGHLQYFHAALEKYGVDAFKFQVIETFDTEDDALSAEQFWVAYLRSNVRGYGFNLDSGGRNGRRLSDEAKRRISEKLTGVPHSPERAAKSAASRVGMVFSDEHRARIAASGKGRIVTAETREKIAAGHRGRKLSPEHVAKMRAARIGCSSSDETKRKTSESMKAVWAARRKESNV